MYLGAFENIKKYFNDTQLLESNPKRSMLKSKLKMGSDC